jgi:hypothetical protein
MTAAEPAASTDPWTTQFQQLEARYRHVRKPIVAALNVLLHDQNATLEDAKAQAAARGIRITAASLNGARTLLAKMDAPATAAATAATSSATRAPRRQRPADKGVDAEALVRGFVAKLQGHGNAEAEGLREAMRRAIAVLHAAIG